MSDPVMPADAWRDVVGAIGPRLRDGLTTISGRGPSSASGCCGRLAVLGVTVALIAAACSSDGDDLDVVGSWAVSGIGERALVDYAADGTYSIRAVGDVTGRAYDLDRGEYSLDGGRITYTSTALSDACDEGATGVYTVEASDPTAWSVAVVNDECSTRAEGSPFTHTAP